MIKYIGYIENIDKKYAFCVLHNDEMPSFKFGMEIPIKEIDKSYRNLGQIFYLYINDLNKIELDYKIEWLTELPPTKLSDTDNENIEKFLKLFDE